MQRGVRIGRDLRPQRGVLPWGNLGGSSGARLGRHGAAVASPLPPAGQRASAGAKAARDLSRAPAGIRRLEYLFAQLLRVLGTFHAGSVSSHHAREKRQQYQTAEEQSRIVVEAPNADSSVPWRLLDLVLHHQYPVHSDLLVT